MQVSVLTNNKKKIIPMIRLKWTKLVTRQNNIKYMQYTRQATYSEKLLWVILINYKIRGQKKHTSLAEEMINKELNDQFSQEEFCP